MTGRIPNFFGIIIAFYEAVFQANGVRLVFLALLTTACAKAKTTDIANNESLSPPQCGRWCAPPLRKPDPAPKWPMLSSGPLCLMSLFPNYEVRAMV